MHYQSETHRYRTHNDRKTAKRSAPSVGYHIFTAAAFILAAILAIYGAIGTNTNQLSPKEKAETVIAGTAAVLIMTAIVFIPAVIK